MMTDDQRLIVDTARTFRARATGAARRGVGRRWQVASGGPARAGRLGFLGMTVDPEWGGAGTDYVAYALALMEIAAGDGSISTVMSVQNAPVCAVLAGHGNDAQKARWLRPLASGTMIGAFAFDRARSRFRRREPQDPGRASR